MLEKVVLLLALVAVWSLAAGTTGTTGTTGAIAEPARTARDSGPQGFLARAGIPFGLVIGGYIFWVGADAPGGAFAGGAIISAMLLLAMLAGEGGRLRTTGFAVRGLAGLGVLVFVLAGLGAMALGMPFLSYPADWAKPVIVVLEIAMTLSVGVTLALLVQGPPQTSGRP